MFPVIMKKTSNDVKWFYHSILLDVFTVFSDSFAFVTTRVLKAKILRVKQEFAKFYPTESTHYLCVDDKYIIAEKEGHVKISNPEDQLTT